MGTKTRLSGSNLAKSGIIIVPFKLRNYNTNVKAVLLYGCETWKNSKYITTKLQVFTNKSLRKTLRIFWPDQITNNELWKRTKQPRIDLHIMKREWGWLGHTLRKPTDDYLNFYTVQELRYKGK